MSGQDQAHDLRLIVDGRIAAKAQLGASGGPAQLDGHGRLGEGVGEAQVKARGDRTVEKDAAVIELEAL